MSKVLPTLRQTIYSLFSFGYFLYLAADLTVKGFFLLTLGGRTEVHKRKYHELLRRKAQFVVHHIPGTTFTYNNAIRETFSNPTVIISNHQSHLDLMAIMMLTPKLIILTKSWVWNNPFYGFVIRYADYLATDSPTLMEQIKDRVLQGYSVMVFPEGTRSSDCSIGRFHRGAFKIAEDLNLDIIPVFIKGFGKVLPKTSFHLERGVLSLEVLPRFKRQNKAWEKGGYRSVTKIMHQIYKEKNEEMRDNR